MRLHFNGASSAFIAALTAEGLTDYLPIDPSQSSSYGLNARILTAQFGDGYSQRGADGINVSTLKFSLTFTNRRQEIIRNIEAFFLGDGGTYYNRTITEPFLWTPPAPRNTSELLFIVEPQWTTNYGQGTHSSLSCNFIQVFDP